MGYKHLNIDEQRLKIVNERKRIGDWESDTVVGKGTGRYMDRHGNRKRTDNGIEMMKDKSD